MVRLLDLKLKNLSPGQFRGQLVVGDLTAVPEKDRYLRLGFEDDGYGDNGYWGRDDGTGDQCKNLGTSYVLITITHRVIRPFPPGKEATKEAESRPRRRPRPSRSAEALVGEGRETSPALRHLSRKRDQSRSPPASPRTFAIQRISRVD